MSVRQAGQGGAGWWRNALSPPDVRWTVAGVRPADAATVSPAGRTLLIGQGYPEMVQTNFGRIRDAS